MKLLANQNKRNKSQESSKQMILLHNYKKNDQQQAKLQFNQNQIKLQSQPMYSNNQNVLSNTTGSFNFSQPRQQIHGIQPKAQQIFIQSQPIATAKKNTNKSLDYSPLKRVQSKEQLQPSLCSMKFSEFLKYISQYQIESLLSQTLQQIYNEKIVGKQLVSFQNIQQNSDTKNLKQSIIKEQNKQVLIQQCINQLQQNLQNFDQIIRQKHQLKFEQEQQLQNIKQKVSQLQIDLEMNQSQQKKSIQAEDFERAQRFEISIQQIQNNLEKLESSEKDMMFNNDYFQKIEKTYNYIKDFQSGQKHVFLQSTEVYPQIENFIDNNVKIQLQKSIILSELESWEKKYRIIKKEEQQNILNLDDYIKNFDKGLVNQLTQDNEPNFNDKYYTIYQFTSLIQSQSNFLKQLFENSMQLIDNQLQYSKINEYIEFQLSKQQSLDLRFKQLAERKQFNEAQTLQYQIKQVQNQLENEYKKKHYQVQQIQESREEIDSIVQTINKLNLKQIDMESIL